MPDLLATPNLTCSKSAVHTIILRRSNSLIVVEFVFGPSMDPRILRRIPLAEGPADLPKLHEHLLEGMEVMPGNRMA